YLAHYPTGEHAPEARWFVAWSLHELDRPDEALAALTALESKHPKTERAPSARYWRARVGTDADAALRTIAASTPTSPYAYFAARRAGTTWPRRRPDPFTPQELGT